MNLHRIAYISQATKQFTKRDLLDLLHDSRAYNTLDNISGVLIHKQGFFFQIIEGEQEVVNELLTRLLNDPRHSEIKIILDSSADNRLFSNWAMGCADFEDPGLSLIPGIRNDLTDPKVIEDLITRLPEIATFLHDKLTDQQIRGSGEHEKQNS